MMWHIVINYGRGRILIHDLHSHQKYSFFDIILICKNVNNYYLGLCHFQCISSIQKMRIIVKVFFNILHSFQIVSHVDIIY
jgi:hypothetical protein